jgi:hypothetical protein
METACLMNLYTDKDCCLTGNNRGGQRLYRCIALLPYKSATQQQLHGIPAAGLLKKMPCPTTGNLFCIVS